VTLTVSVDAVREYLSLNTTPSTSQYTDATISSNILAAQSRLEQVTGRFFVDQTFDTVPYRQTTMLRAQIPIPGFRTFTQVSWGGTILTVDVNDPSAASVWAVPDAMQTGLYTGLQFRAFRADAQGLPWWIADRNWFDKALDSPFYPGNYGGGYFYSSMPNDLLITGDAGYAQGSEPYDWLHAVKVLASFYTMRPASILADVAITPAGGILNYSQMPPEVREFIAAWKGGAMMVSVGG
jgi:hypothetical protein